MINSHIFSHLNYSIKSTCRHQVNIKFAIMKYETSWFFTSNSAVLKECIMKYIVSFTNQIFQNILKNNDTYEIYIIYRLKSITKCDKLWNQADFTSPGVHYEKCQIKKFLPHFRFRQNFFLWSPMVVLYASILRYFLHIHLCKKVNFDFGLWANIP